MSDNNPFEPIETTPFQSHPPQNVHGWERIGSLAGGVLMMGKGLRRGGVLGLAQLAIGGMALARGSPGIVRPRPCWKRTGRTSATPVPVSNRPVMS